ncbi:MarR family transcriptional regulator [Pseudonocardia sp. T1-2H]|uniref:MarR family transcriptional regulator n=1 Tax=Pseudonocardia sp. T1-2H TaxID=3128899 RepID=UPI00310134CA
MTVLPAGLDARGLESGVWVVADLSLGAWGGRSAAAQLAAQVDAALGSGIDLGIADAAATDVDWSLRAVEYADFIGHAVDRESLGDLLVIDAITAADIVGERLRRRGVGGCLAVLPVSPEAPSRYDRAFLAGLRRRIEPDLTLVVADAEALTAAGNLGRPDPGSAARTTLALVPGLVDPALQGAFADDPAVAALLPTPSGLFVVPPALRCTAAAAGPLDFDRLAARTRGLSGLCAYAQRYGNAHFIDLALLCRQAWAELAHHHEEAAFDLLGHAVRCARTPHARAVCEAQLCGLAIALRRFDVAAAAVPAPASAPAELRGFLQQSRGWGLVMSGEPQKALAEFTAAADSLAGWRQRREFLYLMNITALAALRNGDLPAALALEDEIAAALRSSAEPDQRLRYVNEMNLARLHRRRGKAGAARAHYAAAFATTHRVGSQFDLLHAELCAAHLDALEGAPGRAAWSWLRAALLWAAIDHPEAVGARVAAAVDGTVNLRGTPDPRRVTDALLARLRGCGWAVPASGRPAGIAWLAPDTPVDPDAALVVEAHWAVVLAAARTVTPPERDDCRTDLRQAVIDVLATQRPLPDWCRSPAVLVDDRLRRGLPCRPTHAVESALRLGVRRLVIAGREHRIDPVEAGAALLRLRVTVSAAVGRPAPGDDRVRFHRYRRPRLLRPDEQEVLHIATEATVPRMADLLERLGVDPDATVRTVRRLEAAGVLDLTLDDHEGRRLLESTALGGAPWEVAQT